MTQKQRLGEYEYEKEQLERKLKNTEEKLRNKIHENELLHGQPMDEYQMREESLLSAHKRIEELEQDLVDSEA